MNIGKPTMRTYVLLACLIIVVGFHWYQKPVPWGKSHLAQVRQPIYPRKIKSTGQQQDSSAAKTTDPMLIKNITKLREVLYSQGIFSHIIAPFQPTTPWQRTEIERHKAGLVENQYDYIVLPVEEVVAENDRVSRLMSASWISKAIEQSSGKRVMPPEQTLRLLGGSATHFQDKAVSEIAEITGADIVYLFHKNNILPTKNNSIMAVLADSGGNIKKRSSQNLTKVNKKQPLETLIANTATSITADLLDVQPVKNPQQLFHLDNKGSFPEQLTNLLKPNQNALQQAVNLQLVAILTPQWLEYERRRLFERSLYALNSVKPDSDEYNLLTARALYYLSRRPVAMPYLSQARSPAEVALREFLNGNYPEMLAAIPKIQSPVLQAIAYIELGQLAYTYDKSPVDSQVFSVDGPWAKLLSTALKDSDRWYAPDNLSFFTQLNGLFNEFDTLLKQVIKEEAVSGEFKPYGEHEELIEKVFARASLQSGPACCPIYSGQLESTDLWQLYRNHGIANLLRDLNRSVNVHGSYTNPRAVAERMKPWFLGQPSFLRLYAEALKGDSRNKQGTEKIYLLEQAYTMANDAGIFAATINDDTLRADKLLREITPYLPTSTQRSNKPQFSVYQIGDFPSSRQYGGAGGFIDILDFSNSRFDGLERAYNTGMLDEDRINTELSTRFNGHPDKTVFQAKRMVSTGNMENAISLLRNEVQSGSNVWKDYEYLNELLVKASNYSNASKTCLQYPDFKSIPDGKSVSISNHAMDCGDRLFWIGQFNEAKPLYKIAASLKNGSGSQFKATQRLALYDKDFRKAIRYAFKRGQRYNSRYGYRDYLVYMHLLGFHEEAENGFRGLVSRFDSPPIWTSMFVGQRIQDKALSDIKHWTHSILAQSSGNDLGKQAERYVMLQTVMDRQVDRNSLKAVAEFAASSKQPQHNNPRPEFHEAIQKNTELKYQLKISCKQRPENCSNDSAATKELSANLYTGFMQAYILLKADNYEESLNKFLAYDKYHDFSRSTNKSSFALPYAAMAVAKSRPAGDLSKLLAVVEKAQGEERFDADLTRSVIFASQGNPDQALVALTDAFHNRPHTKWRPIFSWYQLTETAEWLHEVTGDERFIQHALKWAKGYQLIQPQFAWAYAFEALYSKNKADRVRAAGYAAYLDSRSEWLQHVPKNIREQGAIWWDENEPYEKIKKEMNKQEQAETSA